MGLRRSGPRPHQPRNPRRSQPRPRPPNPPRSPHRPPPPDPSPPPPAGTPPRPDAAGPGSPAGPPRPDAGAPPAAPYYRYEPNLGSPRDQYTRADVTHAGSRQPEVPARFVATVDGETL